MWRYAIIAEDGECLESGMFDDPDAMEWYCERRMKRLNAYTWMAERDEAEEKKGD